MPISTYPRPPREAQGPPQEPGEATAPGKHLIAPPPCQTGWVESRRPGRLVKPLTSDVRGRLETLVGTHAYSQPLPAQSPAGPWLTLLMSLSAPASFPEGAFPACAAAWHFGLLCQGFPETPGQVLRAAILPEVLGYQSEDRAPGLTLSATHPHQLLLASLPLGTKEEFRVRGTSKSLF